MKEKINFLKIFTSREIIETILLFIIAFLLIDMFNIHTFLLENYDIYCIIALIVVITFFIKNKRMLILSITLQEFLTLSATDYHFHLLDLLNISYPMPPHNLVQFLYRRLHFLLM